ncbi:MAG: alpha/beta hydrolase [Lachnospiraceae bacterium]|nr:alpha/beta hydrolase [Lachnospiraceae bacterium]
MVNPVMVGLCKKERRKFQELAETSNLQCESYPDITQIPNILYMDYDYPNHNMDLYFPTNPPTGLPLIIDIHGGGLMSGSKEFNKPFCCELARAGFIVMAIEYPKVPEATLSTMLNDVLTAEAKAIEYARSLNPSPNQVCIIGDSAGAFLALYTTAIIKNPKLASEFGIENVPDIPISALGFISGLFYTTANDYYGAFYKRLLYGKSAIRFDIPKHVDPDCEEVAGVLPPCYILTSAGDYLKDYTIRFERALSRYHIQHVYQYMRNKQLQHDFPVMDTNAIESKGVIIDIANTFKRYLWEAESTSTSAN